jgi:hypothetical protein
MPFVEGSLWGNPYSPALRLFLEDYYLPEGEQAIGMGPEMMPAPNTAGIEVITLRK